MKIAYKTVILISGLIFATTSSAHAVNLSIGGVRINKDVKNMQEIKSQGVVRQSLDFSCGAAGLSTILNFHLNDHITEQEIINDILKTVDLAKVKARKGFSLLDLKQFVESKGYKATGYKMDIKFLAELGKPVMVPIKFKNYRHFIIVKAIVGDRVYITDPAVGNMTMKTARFQNIWTQGIGLVIEHEDSSNSVNSSTLVKKEDARFADYKNIARTIRSNILRTAIFPNEWD